MKGMENNPHKKHRERLRKQFLDKHLSSFHDHQKLELLLFYLSCYILYHKKVVL